MVIDWKKELNAPTPEPPLLIWVEGPPKMGKTWTSLALAKGMGELTVLIDTEDGSALHYRNQFPFVHRPLKDYRPQSYEKYVDEAVESGATCVVIDSGSHMWDSGGGPGDAFALHAALGGGEKATFTNWRRVKGEFRRFLAKLRTLPMPVIVTVRSEEKREIERRGSSIVMRSIGLQPVMMKGAAYEFDVCCMMEFGTMTVAGRIAEMNGLKYKHPGPELGAAILAWKRGERDRKRFEDLAYFETEENNND